ncbi:hypothetical protein KC318_g8647 [Hortaea werneckii]|nr:hypothetical protein KC334_g8526 [Hortaea werneckii]KAI7002600.1 hypothetical protein KC355_g9711 [Hortaea werneckii]KAI7169842.1 hypothetical protein KC324_g11232 [Hortaea werneckii]KAI7574662.1 hypothetical protein KC316_g11375 [Hortaea werneckii]KAI7662839.1 hypothetical protein KC318_g8647 [Hortaea werneckii]
MTDNSTHLSGDEAPASTSDSPQTAVATPPKRVNFPLPRELRDQIYGYLLHHEFTEHSKYPESDTQDAGLPSSYKFHTSILAVNTQIGREATEVLRSNDFVQVTTPWPVVIDLKALEVPIVCDLASRNHHFDHLRIDYKLHVHSPRIPSDRERRLVVVRFGLIKFCRFLQFNLLGFPPFGPVVLFGTGSKEKRPPQVIWNLDEQYKITSAITVHDKIGKPLSTTAKRRLLEPFRNLIIGGQSMEINTILPEHELATFKLFVAPPVMNSLPMTWRSFELALEMKAVADRHVLTGHSTQATRLYRDISYAKKNVRDIMALNNHEEVADYFDHDVNYLKGLNSQDDGTAVKQIFDQSKLSLFQLPPLVFNFPLPDGWSKPVGWFGFLDREIYEVMLNNGLVSAP